LALEILNRELGLEWLLLEGGGGDWAFDIKYDGFRGLCYIEQGRSRLISRNGNIMTRVAPLADQIRSRARHWTSAQ
jgi:ATP-dependent DNA ligase